MSRLDWNAKIIPAIEGEAQFDLFKFIFNVNLNIAFPLQTGDMQDYDWITTTKELGYDNFSTHDLISQKFVNIDFKTGYKIEVPYVNFLPQAGIFYRNVKYEAHGGYGQYSAEGPVNDSVLKKKFAGTVLTYEYDVWAPTISLKIDFHLLKNFGWEFGFYGAFIPWLSYRAIDSHYTTATEYDDTGNGGWGLILGTTVSYKKIIVDFCWEYFEVLTGSTVSSNIGLNSVKHSQLSIPGLDSSLFKISLKYRF